MLKIIYNILIIMEHLSLRFYYSIANFALLCYALRKDAVLYPTNEG